MSEQQREPRRRVIERDPGGGAFRTALRLECGHVIYVLPHGRYAHAKTVGCPPCAEDRPVDIRDLIEFRGTFSPPASLPEEIQQ